uniref:Uncharacterized protein n=1 Tax=Solanum lycopersicum TaxID=4081 RepID=A0A3Q7HFS6_SOLLC
MENGPVQVRNSARKQSHILQSCSYAIASKQSHLLQVLSLSYKCFMFTCYTLDVPRAISNILHFSY